MSSHENATPIRVVHNSAGHLSGPSRSLGGVVIGYLGVRVFCPRPVAAMLDNVGGCSVLLGEYNRRMVLNTINPKEILGRFDSFTRGMVLVRIFSRGYGVPPHPPTTRVVSIVTNLRIAYFME